MGYVYMKVLEGTPETYQSGISRLTKGLISEIYERILTHVQEGDKVVDLGCGPGVLAILCASKGAEVIAIDSSEAMISHAKEQSAKQGVSERIRFIHGDFTELRRFVDPASVDLVVSTLALSETRHLEQQIVFSRCWEVLTEGGRIAFADEVVPKGWGFNRLSYSIKRFFYGALTYWKTKKTTRAIRRFRERLEATGFEMLQSERFLGGTIELNVVRKREDLHPPELLQDRKMRGVRGRIRGALCVLRAGSALIPIEPGLYGYGAPGRQSPVLVTANYQLTVGRVGHALQDQDVYLLVADTMGENVWCAARGDKFSAKEVGEVVSATRIEELVNHRELILPQLAAGGVNHREVKKTTGWSARFGPIYAKDIPAYLKTGRKTQQQRAVSFDLKQRTEMALQQSFFLSKFFFFWLFLFGLVGVVLYPDFTSAWIVIFLLPTMWLSYLLYAWLFPLFPTSSFLRRGMMYGIFLGAVFGSYGIVRQAFLLEIGQLLVIGFALGLFLGMDFSGATPISKPTDIDQEYPTMIILLGICVLTLLIMAFAELILVG